MVMPDPSSIATGADAGTQAELERLRAERDAAVKTLEKERRKKAIGGGFRRTAVGILVLLVAVLLPVTATVTWVRHTVMNTDNYVATVAPIAKDPAVQQALARTVTDQLFATLDPQAKVADALPPKAAFLAAPITNGIKGFVQDKVTVAVQSDAFATIWTKANQVAHQALKKLLNGDSKALTTTNGYLTLNLVPLINQVLAEVSQQVSALLNKQITLPTLTGDELPAVACQKVSAALGRPLPETCGQIPLFPADKLTQARQAVSFFNHLVVALLIAVPLLAVLAMVLTRRRRRTLMQMSVGVALGMVVVRRVVFWLQNTLIATGRPENKAARSAIVHQLLNAFFTMTLWVLWIALAVVVVSAVTGPYRWAVTARTRTADGARTAWRWTQAGFGQARGAAAPGGWVPAHVDALKIGTAVVAVLLVLLLNVNWIGLLVIAALAAAAEVWLYRVGVAVASGSANGPTGPATGTPTGTATGTTA